MQKPVPFKNLICNYRGKIRKRFLKGTGIETLRAWKAVSRQENGKKVVLKNFPKREEPPPFQGNGSFLFIFSRGLDNCYYSVGRDLKTRCSVTARLASIINAFSDFRQGLIEHKNKSHYKKPQAMNDNESRKNLPSAKPIRLEPLRLETCAVLSALCPSLFPYPNNCCKSDRTKQA